MISALYADCKGGGSGKAGALKLGIIFFENLCKQGHQKVIYNLSPSAGPKCTWLN